MMARLTSTRLVCRLNQNIVMLSGYWPLNGAALCLLPREGEPVVILPEQDRALGDRTAS
jgi:hypothetical protein